MLSKVKWVPLGALIEPVRIKNSDGIEQVFGIDINHRFIETRAKLDGVDLTRYALVPPHCFACNLMHIGRDERIPLAYNDGEETIVVTSAYYVFRIKEEAADKISNAYLYLYLSLPESDRLMWFCTDSSVRGNLPESRLFDVKIPLPSMATQKALTDVWCGIEDLHCDSAAQAAPLMSLCMSFLARLRKNYPEIAIGDGYIEPCSEENGERYDLSSLRGISIKKAFIETKANMEGVSLRSYKVVHPHEFAFVTVTSRNGGKISLALNTEPLPVIVSATYEVFRCNTDKLVPEYLFLWMLKPEFDRYARFHSWGSARETFSFDDMKRVKIPIPPLEIQQAVVDLYKCARESKEIAEAAAALKKAVTPALAQYAIHS